MTISSSELGGIVLQHYRSLPEWAGRSRWQAKLPWLFVFIAIPLAGAVGLPFGGLDPKAVAPGLLAGIAVLGGLLFSVLAWIASRIGSIADTMEGRAATPSQLELLRRLDIARANTAYTAAISVVFVVELGVSSMLKQSPTWLNGVSAFLLFHVGLTLLLVVVRINRIGESDRIAALTAHARDSGVRRVG